MKTTVLARQWHSRLMLACGIQLFIWLVGGLYMVAINLNFIHGDHLVKNLEVPLAVPPQPLVKTSEILSRFGPVESVTLITMLERPVYIVKSGQRSHLLDAITTEQLSPINEAMAKKLAHFYYRGNATIAGIELITSNPPSEIYSRPLPLWRINFDDVINTSFYIDPNTATLVTRRHSYWRLFDVFWMLHIMDYDSRSDVNNNLLKFFAMLSILSIIFGGILFYRIRRH